MHVKEDTQTGNFSDKILLWFSWYFSSSISRHETLDTPSLPTKSLDSREAKEKSIKRRRINQSREPVVEFGSSSS